MRTFAWLGICLALLSCKSGPDLRRMPAGSSIQHPSLQKTETDFYGYTGAYVNPEFLDDNEQALKARLKLLDQVPAGGQVKVMTFVHDNGYATKALAAHLCLAAKRGVNIQYIADSKSGDRPGKDDMFDQDPGNKVNEELYQMLVNCGASVKIHNHIEEFETVSERFDVIAAKFGLNLNIGGTHIPRLPQGWKAWTLGQFSKSAGQAVALADLGKDLGGLISEHVKKISDQEELAQAKKIFWDLLRKVANAYFNQTGNESLMEEIQKTVQAYSAERKYSLVGQGRPFNPEAVEKFIWDFIEKLRTHERLGQFYRQARVINRLNHRKLFHVSYGNSTCMFLGGRNLGDHYLTWNRHHDEFMDGDVFICNHHLSGKSQRDVLKEASASFDELWNNRDKFDPLNVEPVLTTIQPDPQYPYRYLKFPDRKENGWGNLMWIFTPQDSATGNWLFPDIRAANGSRQERLTDEDRFLVAPTLWENNEPVHGAPIEEASGWRVQLSNWNPAKDYVRAELLKAIKREREHIYLETAYSELNMKFRNAIEGALQKGVPVELVTNSIFVADGGSKAIRLLMARWTRQMLEKYNQTGKPALFTVRYATIAHGHMIHFKGASFACQEGGQSRFYRLNLAGSHNFHGRSGYSDKEHAILWEQPPKASCAGKFGGTASTAKDLRDLRNEFYARLAAGSRTAPLKPYRNLAEEFNDAMASGKLSKGRLQFAKLFLKFIYGAKENQNGTLEFKTDGNGNAVVRAQEHVFELMDVLAESGFSDVFGALL